MGTLNPREMRQALEKAAEIRETGQAPGVLAKALPSLNYRVQKMEQVRDAVRRYLQAGQSSNAHRLLLQTILQAEKALHDQENVREIPDFTKGNFG